LCGLSDCAEQDNEEQDDDIREKATMEKYNKMRRRMKRK
jgi:hypothetical protein